MPRKPGDDHHWPDFFLILLAFVLLFIFWQGALFIIRLVSGAAD